MTLHKRVASRLTNATLVVFMAVAVLIPALTQTVSAAQLTSRSMQMSSSAASATGVSYLTSFTTAGSAQSLVIDFCSQSPIIGDTCTTPTGFTAASATVTGSGMGGWTITPSAGKIQLVGGAAIGAGAQSFTLQNITNPSTNGSFYARIYTYAGASPSWVSATNPGTYVDHGGIALSVANTISITARVQETLTFCVSGSAPTAGCGGVTTPAVTLGHGSPTPVLDAATVDTNASTTPTYTQISTNASAGAIINMKNSNTCGGLSSDSGATCAIGPANGGTAVGPIVAGDGEFGLNVGAGSGGTGTVTPDTNYAGAGNYGMWTGAGGVTSTYGDTIAACTAPVSNVNNQLTFAATAANTTPAGIYTATMTLIATGTF